MKCKHCQEQVAIYKSPKSLNWVAECECCYTESGLLERLPDLHAIRAMEARQNAKQ